MTVPPESEQVTTLPPSSSTFSIVYCDTLPDPDTDTRMPSNDNPLRASISWTKYTTP